jgi:hypothetical protein
VGEKKTSLRPGVDAASEGVVTGAGDVNMGAGVGAGGANLIIPSSAEDGASDDRGGCCGVKKMSKSIAEVDASEGGGSCCVDVGCGCWDEGGGC